MNIKTTIILFLLLAGVGTYVFFTRDKDKADDTTTAKHEDKVLLDLKDKADKIVAFSIQGSGGKDLAAEKSGGVWKMTKPVAALLDKTKVESLLTTLTTLQSTEQISGAGTASTTCGLDRPTYTLNLTTQDDKGKGEVKLLVGDRLAGESVYTQVRGHDMIDIVPSSLLETLGAPANSLRNSKLFDFAAASVQQMNITEKDGSELSLRNNLTGWQLTRPVSLPADAATVQDLMAAVVNMRVVEFMDHAKLSMGLNKPQAVVTLSTAAPATQPATMATAAAQMPGAVKVIFGGYDDVSMQNVYAQIPDGTIVKVPASVLEALDKKPLDLRDRTIVTIDPAQVAKLTISTNQPATTQPFPTPATNTLVSLSLRPPTPPKAVHTVPLGPNLIKPTTGPSSMPTSQPIEPEAPKSVWKLDARTPDEADDAKVTALLAQFNPLRAEKYLEKMPVTKPAKQFTISIFTKGPAAPTVLTLIDPGNEANLIGTYAGLTFEVPRAIATDLSGDFTKSAMPAMPSMPSMPPGRRSFP